VPYQQRAVAVLITFSVRLPRAAVTPGYLPSPSGSPSFIFAFTVGSPHGANAYLFSDYLLAGSFAAGDVPLTYAFYLVSFCSSTLSPSTICLFSAGFACFPAFVSLLATARVPLRFTVRFFMTVPACITFPKLLTDYVPFCVLCAAYGFAVCITAVRPSPFIPRLAFFLISYYVIFVLYHVRVLLPVLSPFFLACAQPLPAFHLYASALATALLPLAVPALLLPVRCSRILLAWLYVSPPGSPTTYVLKRLRCGSAAAFFFAVPAMPAGPSRCLFHVPSAACHYACYTCYLLL